MEKENLLSFCVELLEVDEAEISNAITRLNINNKLFIEKIDSKDFVFRKSM